MIRRLTYKKVYVNTKYRTPDSKSSSDFKIQLRESFEVPENTICQVHEISIPHSWYSINTNNQNLYFRHQVLPPSTPQGITYRRVIIPEGNYTAPELANAIKTELNNVFDSGGRTDTYGAVYNTLSNNITISSNYPDIIFIPLTDNDVVPIAGSFSNSVDVNSLQSINTVLSFYDTVNDAYTSSAPWTTGFINLLYHQDIYIACPELSNNNFHTPSSYSNAVVKKVSVNAPFAGVVVDSHGISEYDYINVSKRTITTLTFRLLDETGNTIDLNGANASFSLLFHNIDM